MRRTVTGIALALANLQLTYVQQSVADPVFKAKIEKLVTDYTDLLKLT